MRQSSQSEDNRARLRAASVENIIQAFMVMLGFFLCCYIPSCIIIYIMILCSSCNCTTIHVFRDLQSLSCLRSSSALNPFVEPVRPSLLKVVKRKINYDKIINLSCMLSRSFGNIHPFLMYSSFKGKYSFFCSLYFL